MLSFATWSNDDCDLMKYHCSLPEKLGLVPVIIFGVNFKNRAPMAHNKKELVTGSGYLA